MPNWSSTTLSRLCQSGSSATAPATLTGTGSVSAAERGRADRPQHRRGGACGAHARRHQTSRRAGQRDARRRTPIVAITTFAHAAYFAPSATPRSEWPTPSAVVGDGRNAQFRGARRSRDRDGDAGRPLDGDARARQVVPGSVRARADAGRVTVATERGYGMVVAASAGGRLANSGCARRVPPTAALQPEHVERHGARASE